MGKTPSWIWCWTTMTFPIDGSLKKNYLSPMSTFVNPHLIINSSELKPGKVGWRSPSNLAIIKYWGKHGRQLPRNPSLSLTLSKAYTETIIEYRAKKNKKEDIELDFFFHDAPLESFRQRLLKYLESLMEVFPFLKQLHLTVRSENSFPHSTGIASSASAMSALALGLCSLEHRLFKTLDEDDRFRRKASYLARLGSGSACRSIYAYAGFWGEHGEMEGSSDEYAISAADDLHESFKTYCDDILIVSSEKKSVSSSAGHELMETHAFASARFKNAYQRMHRLLACLKQGDLEEFGRLTETEALTLHGLMMSSYPPYLLVLPNTLEIIRRVQAYRQDTGHPICFSLDAGPNPHLLYPGSIREEVQAFIKSDLLPFCEKERFIEDAVGKGPEELIEE